jgi:8-oxo-dGTP pyrophosphatase MutT (NUDIX family)
MLSFDSKRNSTLPRDAATVIVLRDCAHGHGIETFCVLRHISSSFLGGAMVFPGGKVEPADAADVWGDRATAPHPRGAAFATEQLSARALAVAACREMLEEGGILPTDRPLAAAEALSLRAELLISPATTDGAPPPLATALERRGLTLSLGALVPWARWITPAAEATRFDARFFLLELPEGQEGRHDERETTMSFWARPTDVLDRFVRGELFLAPPTTRTLEMLAGARDRKEALALASEQSLAPICPTFVPADPPFLALPGDPAHEVSGGSVPGPTRFVLRNGRFVSEQPPAQASAIVPSSTAVVSTTRETRSSRRSP